MCLGNLQCTCLDQLICVLFQVGEQGLSWVGKGRKICNKDADSNSPPWHRTPHFFLQWCWCQIPPPSSAIQTTHTSPPSLTTASLLTNPKFWAQWTRALLLIPTGSYMGVYLYQLVFEQNIDCFWRKKKSLLQDIMRECSICAQKAIHPQFSSVTQSCPTLQPHGLQHARLPCPSPTPRA